MPRVIRSQVFLRHPFRGFLQSPCLFEGFDELLRLHLKLGWLRCFHKGLGPRSECVLLLVLFLFRGGPPHQYIIEERIVEDILLAPFVLQGSVRRVERRWVCALSTC